MTKRRKVLLALMALVLVIGVGAKLYGTITMGDDEWVGLGASAGRIVFDDQPTDEVIVMDAHFGVGLTNPTADLHTFGGTGAKIHRENASTNNVAAVQIWTRTSTGTVADGFGTDLRFNLEDDGGVTRQAGNIYVAWSDVSEDEAYMAFKLRDGSTTEKMRLDHEGDLEVDKDVTTGGSVFIGSGEDNSNDPEDGAHMTTRADNDDGGYMFWAMRNITAGQLIFPDRYAGGGGSDVGPETVLWAQWLARDNTTGIVTEGDAALSGVGEVLIAGSGANTLELAMTRPIIPPPGVPAKSPVLLVETGSHNYDVTLLMLWIKES